jgi:hypothetical protein
MTRSRGADSPANAPDPADYSYWFRMGYMYGRADALDGRPYDDRLPSERGADIEADRLTDSQRQPSETSTTRVSDQSTRTSRS